MKIDLLTSQDASSPEISDLFDKLLNAKKEAVERGDESLINSCWRETEALKLNVLFINVFDDLKNHKYRDAWNSLERCEIDAMFLGDNSSEEFLSNTRVRHIQEKVSKWQSIYPYCVFASPAFTVGYYTCSICGHKIRPRSRCSHEKGKVYGGELCLHIAHDMEFQEISLVTKPVQKYSVVHNDETLDFSLINYLVEILDNAFEEWGLNWTTKTFPIDKFSRVDSNSECPCKSGMRFGECCIEKNEIELPHVDFIFSKEIPEEKSKTVFPY